MAAAKYLAVVAKSPVQIVFLMQEGRLKQVITACHVLRCNGLEPVCAGCTAPAPRDQLHKSLAKHAAHALGAVRIITT